jgi:hypothetical protein
MSPTTVAQSLQALVVTPDDLVAAHFPQYVRLVTGELRTIFDVAASPLGLKLMVAASQCGQPAIAGVIDEIERLRNERGETWGWTDRNKQILGAVAKVQMEVNGYPITDQSRSVPHPAFNRARVYYVPRADR